MSIIIDKNVPMPKKGQYQTKYPWRAMKAGDSFAVQCTPTNKNKIRCNLIGSGSRHFPVRTKMEGDAIRVWRVK